jgi:hypothetical protein
MKKNYFFALCLILINIGHTFGVSNNFDGFNQQFKLLNALNIIQVVHEDAPKNTYRASDENRLVVNNSNLFVPTITLPSDLTIECNQDETDLLITGTAIAIDNDSCAADIVITYTDNSNQTSNGSCTDNSFTITRTWRATETCGNTFVEDDQVITVQDTTAPVLTVPADDTVECDAVPAVGTPTATDNCDTDVQMALVQILIR